MGDDGDFGDEYEQWYQNNSMPKDKAKEKNPSAKRDSAKHESNIC
eukprot:CAMPEP_0116937530 /NCGR_PEP_ID=MMETSP0467-20121206/31562_1 /TAXON_ID=283647 /ORGANISM="Mesodinium pulex, Strain SPMC105" /LENGTH=44 /DNA_ID= /DNA_START= /DNA_END= /DNA_ORIENTATION=